MPSIARKLRERYEPIVEAAQAKCKRNPDGSIREEDLRAAIAKIVRRDLDPDGMADLPAARSIDACAKQDGEEDDEDSSSPMQPCLFKESHPYDPQRLIEDAGGNIIRVD